MGFYSALRFLLGTKKVKESFLSFSWCLRGELGDWEVPLWGFGNGSGGSMYFRIRCGLSDL